MTHNLKRDRSPSLTLHATPDIGVQEALGRRRSANTFPRLLRLDRTSACCRVAPGETRLSGSRYYYALASHVHAGGIYSDIDIELKEPLKAWVGPDDEVVTGTGARGDVHQWGLIYRARRAIMPPSRFL